MHIIKSKYSILFYFHNLQAKRSIISTKNDLILMKLFFCCIFIFTNHENHTFEISLLYAKHIDIIYN